MKALDGLGDFWLPGYESDSLSGRLKFDPSEDGGITLSLVGKFDNASDDRGEPNVRIVGWLGNDRITLDRCFSLSGESFRSPGIPESRYYANQMFLGHHFEEGIGLEFTTANVEIGALADWVDKTGIIVDDRMSTPPSSGHVFGMTFSPLDNETCEFSRGLVNLSYKWRREGDEVRGVRFRQWPFVKFAYNEFQPFEVIRKDVGRLQNLITLCFDDPVDLDSLTLTRPDIRMRAISGNEMPFEQPIEYIAPPLKYTPPHARKPRYWHQMLLNYEELGGIDFVANWIDTSEGFQRPLDSFMSIRHAKHMFAENRFLNVTFAAEAFHRVAYGGINMDPELFEQLFATYLEHTPREHHDWLRSRIEYGNVPSLRKRLLELASRAGEATRPLIGDKRDWSFIVARVRNELTHLGAQQFSGSDLLFLTESVYAVVRICMLLDSGAPTDALIQRANSYQMTWYRGRLKETLDRVQSQLRGRS